MKKYPILIIPLLLIAITAILTAYVHFNRLTIVIPTSQSCEELATELNILNSQYTISLTERVTLLFSKEKLTLKKENYNAIYRFILYKHNLTVTEEELNHYWTYATTKATQANLIIFVVTVPVHLRPLQFITYQQQLYKLAVRKCNDQTQEVHNDTS